MAIKQYLALFDSVSDYETFIESEDYITPNVSAIAGSASVFYNPYVLHDYSQDYLTFEALESGTFAFTNDVNYSIDDGETWTPLSANTNTPTINAGEKIIWKAELTPSSSWPNQGIGKFSSTESFNATGNPMSLLYGDNFIGQTNLSGKNYALANLFNGCTNIVDVKNLSLPATTLAKYCYEYMFQGCTSLTTAPELSATTLTEFCYSSMFSGCTSLTTATELPATTLASYCYSNMFSGCTSLTITPTLPATTLVNRCYYQMFQSCTALTSAPALPATTLATDCCYGMFQGCTALTTAPALPATTLAENCYYQMFQSCTALTSAPTLPATTLATGCYQYMFKGCTNLNSITCLSTTNGSINYTFEWVKNVASSGTFTKAASINWTTGNNGIPSGWTVQDYVAS